MLAQVQQSCTPKGLSTSATHKYKAPSAGYARPCVWLTPPIGIFKKVGRSQSSGTRSYGHKPRVARTSAKRCDRDLIRSTQVARDPLYLSALSKNPRPARAGRAGGVLFGSPSLREAQLVLRTRPGPFGTSLVAERLGWRP